MFFWLSLNYLPYNPSVKIWKMNGPDHKFHDNLLKKKISVVPDVQMLFPKMLFLAMSGIYCLYHYSLDSIMQFLLFASRQTLTKLIIAWCYNSMIIAVDHFKVKL